MTSHMGWNGFRTGRRGRRGRTLAMIATLALSLLTGAATASAASAPPVQWGVNPGGELANYRFDPGTSDDRGFDAMAATGFGTVRSAAAWRLADPYGYASAHQARWDWSWSDSVVLAAAKRGMRWQPFICYPPDPYVTWKTTCGGPPNNVNAYDNYLAALVNRYGDGGTFWREHPDLHPMPLRAIEIWNEPNGPNAWPSPYGAAPEEYAWWYQMARFTIAAQPAGKHIAAVFAGLAPTSEHDAARTSGTYGWRTFLTRAVRASGGLPIDAFAFHPYPSGTPGVDPATEVLDLTRDFRGALRSLGRGHAPMYLTEVGIPRSFAFLGFSLLGGPAAESFTEAQRAKFFHDLIPKLAGSDCNIASVSQLQFSSDQDFWTAPPFGDVTAYLRFVATTFSIADPSSQLRPSGEAVKAAITNVDQHDVTPGTSRICGS